MGALRKQMDGDLVVRGMAVRTREAYLGAVAGLAKYYGRPPDRIDEAEVQRYLLYLIEERKLAWASCNVVAQGLKFFYRVTLKRPEAQFGIPRARQPQKLPQILAREEVARLIERTLNPKHRAILMTTYGAGLRLNELRHLKVSDIDSARMTLRVEQGKGAKDRYTLLSPRLLKELRRYTPARAIACAVRSRLDLDVLHPRFDDSALPLRRDGATEARHRWRTHLLALAVDICNTAGSRTRVNGAGRA